MYIEFHFEFNDWNSILHERREQIIIVLSVYNYLDCSILKKLQNILEIVQLMWYFIPIKISHLKYDLSIKNHVKNLKVLY